MADTAAEIPKSILHLHQVFVKDASFESPRSPDVFTWKDYRPETEVDLKAQHHEIDAKEHIHEVLQLIWKKEDDEYAEQFYNDDLNEVID